MLLVDKYDTLDMSEEEKKLAKAFRDSVNPPELHEASKLCNRTMYKVLICLEEAEVDFKKSIEVIKKYNSYDANYAIIAIKKQMRILESQLIELEQIPLK